MQWHVLINRNGLWPWAYMPWIMMSTTLASEIQDWVEGILFTKPDSERLQPGRYTMHIIFHLVPTSAIANPGGTNEKLLHHWLIARIILLRNMSSIKSEHRLTKRNRKAPTRLIFSIITTLEPPGTNPLIEQLEIKLRGQLTYTILLG
jgi:hypothetical protein